MMPTFTARIVELPPLFDGDTLLYFGFVIVDDKRMPRADVCKLGKTRAEVLKKLVVSVNDTCRPTSDYRDDMRDAVNALWEREENA